MPQNWVRGKLLWKPGPGASINWNHPLATNLVGAWLCNHNGGRAAVSLICNQDDIPFIGDTSWVTGRPFGGPLINTFDVSSGCQNTSPSGLLKPTAQVSMHYQGAETGQPSGTDNVAIFSMAYTNTNSTQFWAYGIHRDTTDQTGVYWLDDAGGTSNNIHATGCLTNGTPALSVPFDATLTYDGVNINGYFNGVQKATHARTGSLTYASSMLNLATNFSSSTPRVATDLLLIWNRGLTANEVWWLHNEPYAMLDYHVPRVRVFFGKVVVPVFRPWEDQQLPQLLPQ